MKAAHAQTRRGLPLFPCILCVLAASACAAQKNAEKAALVKELGAIAGALSPGGAKALAKKLSRKQAIGLDPGELQALMEKNPAELAAAAAMLGAPSAVTIEATLTTIAGQSVTLVTEGEGWKLEKAPGLEGPAKTPLEACVLLARKLKLLREKIGKEGLLSATLSHGVKGALDTLTSELEDVEERNFTTEGEKSFVMLPSGKRVELVLEGGAWKIARIFPLSF